MENLLMESALSFLTPYLAPVLVYVATMLTLAGIAHTVATGILRPIAKLTPSELDDKWVELLVWWTDAVSDVLREWALAKWVAGARRVGRMLEDRKKPLSGRRWE